MKKLRRKYGWNKLVFKTVDWKAHRRVIQKLMWIQKIVIIKMMHLWLLTNVKKRKYDSSETETCRGCGGIESQEHILKYMEKNAIKTKKLAWEKLKQNMRKSVHEIVLSHFWY